MTTVAVLVRDALQHLGVVNAVQSIKAVDMADGIRALNLMMRSLETDNLPVGWSDVSSPSETLPLPPETEEAIGYMLAMRLQARFGVDLSPTIVALAVKGEASLSAQVANQAFVRTDLSDLPAGIGARLGDGLHNGLNG